MREHVDIAEQLAIDRVSSFMAPTLPTFNPIAAHLQTKQCS
jgi:hypothetical protein